MISEFIQSIVISASIPIAVFFSFRLHIGSFDNRIFSDYFDIDRVVIDKRALLGLILALLGIIGSIINF
jgi:hypothetical protein